MSAFSRRRLLAGVATLPLVGVAIPSAADAQPAPETDPATLARRALAGATGTKLVMLGTGGGPVAGRRRGMTSHVLISGGSAYVVDCGLGVATQIARIGVPLSHVSNVFITHHHADHNIEYGPLLLLAWIDGRQTPISAYGPPPLAQMTTDYRRMQRFTTENWSADVGIPAFPETIVREIVANGPVMRDALVTVTAAIVQHPPTAPAFGYRFDFHDRSIAFSGDTVAVPAMVELARGADVLVHEAMYLPATEKYVRAMGDKQPDGSTPMSPEAIEHLIDHMKRDHTPADQVGRIAQQAGVKTLVLSHLVPSGGVSDDVWRAEAAKAFTGTIIVASDLLVL